MILYIEDKRKMNVGECIKPHTVAEKELQGKKREMEN